MEVQRGPMDVDGRIERGQPAGDVRDSGDGCRGQRSWGASRAVTWTDAAGNFWLFGGLGYDSAGTLGYLNDLWKYSAGQWTWMGGSNWSTSKGRTALRGRLPPATFLGREPNAVTWTDAAGNFWLFGGDGYASTGSGGDPQRPVEVRALEFPDGAPVASGQWSGIRNPGRSTTPFWTTPDTAGDIRELHFLSVQRIPVYSLNCVIL